MGAGRLRVVIDTDSTVIWDDATAHFPKVRLLEREHQARLESERVSSQLSFLDEAGTAMSSAWCGRSLL